MDIKAILIAVGVIAVIGIIIGIVLGIAEKVFHVEVNEKETAVREVLPGSNCGGCGYAGCDAMAAASAKGEAPVNGCPVGGNDVAQKIAEIMGQEVQEFLNKMMEFENC